MIKGVNKRIIEINNPENEYFEKAILFINPSKIEERDKLVTKNADAYFKTLQERQGKKLKRKSLALSLLLKPAVLFILGAVTAFGTVFFCGR